MAVVPVSNQEVELNSQLNRLLFHEKYVTSSHGDRAQRTYVCSSSLPHIYAPSPTFIDCQLFTNYVAGT
jgi:hypothetical protein